MTTVLDRLAGLEVELGELQESRKVRVQDWSKYIDDPVGWARDVLGFEPWSRQVDIMRSVAANPLTVCRGANGTGKDAVAFGPVALHHVFVRGGMVVAIAPTKRQAEEIGMQELARWWRKGGLPGELFRSALRVNGDRGVLAFTSNEVSRLTGYHHPRLLVILTECQGLEPYVWDAALACAIGAEDRVLAIGNPLINSGVFYKVSRSDDWCSIRMPASEHPNVVEDRDVIPGGISRAGIDRLKKTWGANSPIVRARVEAEFPDQGQEALFRRSWLEEAARKWEEKTFERARTQATPILSVDPARYGPDNTALCVRRGPVIDRIVTWHGKSTMETVGRIEEEAAKEGVTARWERMGRTVRGRGMILVDEVGLGAGIVDRLREKGYHTRGYNGGQFTGHSDRDRFLNERAMSHFRLRDLLEDGKVALPPDEALFDELLAVNWFPTSGDRVQMEQKSKLKDRLGKSPDRGDCVVQAFSDIWRRNQLWVGHYIG